MEIKELGSFHSIDDEGYIENPCRYPVLQAEYARPVDEIIQWYLKLYGNVVHSIYLRGSVAKGQAIPYVSDIDTMAISTRPITETEKKRREGVNTYICEKYKFVKGVEMHFENIENCGKPWLQFLLKTQCVCIYGTDLIPSIKKFKPGKDAYAHINYIIQDMNDVAGELKTEYNSDEIKVICVWIMRRIVRTGFELVMERDNSYSRDLYPNYQSFIKYYPVMANQMRRALELAINPSDNKVIIMRCVNNLKQFFKNEIQKI